MGHTFLDEDQASRVPRIDSINNRLVRHEFGSAHPAVSKVAMADGSVLLMNFDLDMEVQRGNTWWQEKRSPTIVTCGC